MESQKLEFGQNFSGRRATELVDEAHVVQNKSLDTTTTKM